ncbi:hypothetical protein ACXHQC_23545, partial [Vibrio parahaemolyticus]
WSLNCRDLDLSDIKQDASHFYKSEYQRFKENQSYWQSLLHESIPHMEVDESELSYWYSITADYLEGRLFPILS